MAAPFAVSIVLTVFMAGLGLGSYLASRTIDRIQEPAKLVRLYGLLELGVAAYCLVLPLLLWAFAPLYSLLYNRLFEHFMVYSLLTLAGCSLLLVVPVICMGATLPILCRFYVTRLAHLGTHTGRLYGLNTLGAAGGALLTGFWLIGGLGTNGTLVTAVMCNGLIGLSCVLIGSRHAASKASPVRQGAQAQQSGQEGSPASSTSRSSMVAALAIFAVSGFCAMAYEVIWTKLLGLIVGPTTYSFTLVLVTFITCLALGSLVFGWLADREVRPLQLLVATQLSGAVLALLVSQLLGNSQLFFAKLLYHLHGHFAAMSLVKALCLFAMMFPPTFLLGGDVPVGRQDSHAVRLAGGAIHGPGLCSEYRGCGVGLILRGLRPDPTDGQGEGLGPGGGPADHHVPGRGHRGVVQERGTPLAACSHRRSRHGRPGILPAVPRVGRAATLDRPVPTILRPDPGPGDGLAEGLVAGHCHAPGRQGDGTGLRRGWHRRLYERPEERRPAQAWARPSIR